eukprot:Gb_31701 [translate_table: standard]
MGYHIDGSIAVVAHTHVRKPTSRRLADAIVVANTFATKEIQKIVLVFDYKIIEGRLKQFVIDGNRVIRSADTRLDDVEFEENGV